MPCWTGEPSPKFQAKSVKAGTSAGREAVAVKLTSWPVSGFATERAMRANGMRSRTQTLSDGIPRRV